MCRGAFTQTWEQHSETAPETVDVEIKPEVVKELEAENRLFMRLFFRNVNRAPGRDNDERVRLTESATFAGSDIDNTTDTFVPISLTPKAERPLSDGLELEELNGDQKV
ncbi:hypothetical protein BLNAU_2048 [Blattamonas nauphoetae]|uniref:Uncharacterized protein n=1 Tax=Blattamonas nauphoetae TaxID=2049346 RepID=A0ABQ9XKN8_9EUKA|nr:hypothetical protein BLNAU_20633 [Blattamonas nauphoetae]KAK2950695.1 hypothetical protein BLNAU_14366 [Blattamonas nauphoetae]KAK2952852.1 hypothetical protein BLNAU_12173 [Blattamonas nauphoetae]KAK2963025.1 hypothetical protein BLNAU_2048 [Blattamonas nauphoetae]